MLKDYENSWERDLFDKLIEEEFRDPKPKLETKTQSDMSVDMPKEREVKKEIIVEDENDNILGS